MKSKKPNNYWNYQRCKEESKKYQTRTEFKKKNSAAHTVSYRKGWLDEFYPNTKKQKPSGYWTKENCIKESKRYTSRFEFQKKSNGAYHAAHKNKWLDEFTWLKDHKTLNKDSVDCVYAYIFEDYNTVYVGRTVNRVDRDISHKKYDKDPIVKFLLEKGLSLEDDWPEMKILEDNLTILKGLEREDYWVEYYRDQGWTVLNKAKTGTKSGSVGAISNGKWTKAACSAVVSKYKTKSDLRKGNVNVYNKLIRTGWIDEFYPSDKKVKPNGFWSHDRCQEEALRYNTLSEFRVSCPSAYTVSCRNNWIEGFFPGAKRSKPNGYWTHDLAKQEASKYSTPEEFSKHSSGAYAASYKKGWLDEFYPNKNPHKIAVDQLDMEGNFIRSFNSMSDALKFLGKNPKSCSISRVLEGKCEIAYGYKWRYHEDN